MATREAAEGERRDGARCWHAWVAAVVAVEAEECDRAAPDAAGVDVVAPEVNARAERGRVIRRYVNGGCQRHGLVHRRSGQRRAAGLPEVALRGAEVDVLANLQKAAGRERRRVDVDAELVAVDEASRVVQCEACAHARQRAGGCEAAVERGEVDVLVRSNREPTEVHRYIGVCVLGDCGGQATCEDGCGKDEAGREAGVD